MATDHQSIILDFIRKQTGPFGYKELNMHYMQFMVQLLNIVTHLRYITCKNHCLLVQLCWEYQIKCLLNGKNKSICRYEYNGFNPTTQRYLNFDGLIHCCWASHMSFSVRALESPITVSVAPTYKIPIDAYNRRIGGNCQILMTIVCTHRERERERQREGGKQTTASTKGKVSGCSNIKPPATLNVIPSSIWVQHTTNRGTITFSKKKSSWKSTKKACV